MGQALLKLSPSQERVIVRRAKPASTQSTPVGNDHQHGYNQQQQPAAAAADVDPEELLKHEEGSATEERPSHDLTKAGHFTLIVLFYGALIAYCVFLVLSFVNTPSIETNSLLPTERLDPISITLTPLCASTSCGVMSLTTNYTFLADEPARQAACAGGATAPIENRRILTSGQSIEFKLCYAPDTVYSSTTSGALTLPGAVLSMSDIQEGEYASINLEVTASNGETYKKFLTVAPQMVKSFNMGVTKQVVDGSVLKVLPFSKNYQMEGFRLDMISDVVLQLAPYTNLQVIENKRSILTLIADMGSTQELLKLGFIVVVPLWGLLFASKDGNDATVEMKSKSEA